jgi:hypothetical protein
MFLEAVKTNWISFLAYHLVYILIFFFILFAQSCLCVWKSIHVWCYCRKANVAKGKTCSKSCKEKNPLLAKSEVRTTVIHVVQRQIVG